MARQWLAEILFDKSSAWTLRKEYRADKNVVALQRFSAMRETSWRFAVKVRTFRLYSAEALNRRLMSRREGNLGMK